MLYNTDGFGNYAILSSAFEYGQELQIIRYARTFISALIVSLLTRDSDRAIHVVIGSKKSGDVKIVHEWIRKQW